MGASTFTRASVLGLLAALLGALAVVSVAPAARADVGDIVDPTGNGYVAKVRIHFYGLGVPGAAHSISRTVSVSPSCWWAPAAGDYTDAAKMLDWYKSVTNGGQQTRDNIDNYGPISVWKAAADAEAAGSDLSWYRAYCKDPTDYTKFGVGSVDSGLDPVLGNTNTFVTFLYHPYPAGAPIPAPRVPPAELARVARNVMTIPKPVTGRNPMIKSPGQPTLVGLPTWFWVNDPLAVGGAAGALDVTAELNQTDGRVYATVVATTNGLSIDSHWGSTQCTPAQALVHYAAKAKQSTACTVIFAHAGRDMQLTTTTIWDATWTGSGGTGGNLAGLAQNFNGVVSVAEVQNIVTR